ncbi:MAG TPA: ATP-dependent protease ATPase subunit HslU [bacterium]|nr:ATP-dependent protease ATPase subunit HslU [bacterium]HOL48366.1 ATP-dependent protease ATPase subunit HslU [bacterium]HPQ19467.1 ATP-dependent protease ATPase subunit HslU [bacterium]
MNNFSINNLTCKQIVSELDKYIVGQEAAKKAVAIAIRNRYRRLQLSDEMREEVLPKNIIMIGSTGVGKTEIARRLSKIINAPFLKIEATKFTEIGYVGRNVESMIRDLTFIAYNMIKEEKSKEIRNKAELIADNRIKTLLKNDFVKNYQKYDSTSIEEVYKKYSDGLLDDIIIEVPLTKGHLPDFSSLGIIAGSDLDEINIQIKDMFDGIFKAKEKQTKKLTLKNVRKNYIQEEIDKILDFEELAIEAVKLTENSGIIFLDEIDKIIGFEHSGTSPNVSREGVQRDLLPIVEGTTVKTKFGDVKTHHILFISAGAFHFNKPSDLIPELQGRFPIRVTLDNLKKEDLKNILVQPKNSLVKQYQALLEVEKVKLIFEDEALNEIAKIAYELNEKTENIGARRLYAMMEKILEDITFEAPYGKPKTIKIDKKYVVNKLKDIIEDKDLSKYIL